METSEILRLHPSVNGTRFGAHILGGDFTGDGLADLLISAPGYEQGGAVFLFAGGSSGVGTNCFWSAKGMEGHGTVVRIASAGDINRDRTEDFIIQWHVPRGDEGTDYLLRLYIGSTNSALPVSNVLSAQELGSDAPLGMAGAGDINGDGFPDLLVRALARDAASHPSQARDTLFLFLGRNGRFEKSAWHYVAGEPEPRVDYLGAVASAGDVNGDGFADVVIGIPGYHGRYRNSGRAVVFHGSRQGLNTAPDWLFDYDLPAEKDVDEAYEQFLGASVACAGDVNRDGFADVLISAPFADSGDINEGLVFLFHGSRDGLSAKPAWRSQSNHEHARYGWSVGTAGDANADGYADVLVSASDASDGQMREGAVALFHGSPRGLAKWPSWTVESDRTDERIGTCVGRAGDVNGDGIDDFFVSSAAYPGGANQGQVAVHYGRPGGLKAAFNWSIRKPAFVFLNQRLKVYKLRFGAWVYLPPALLALCAGSLWLLREKIFPRTSHALSSLAEEKMRIARDLHDELGARLGEIQLLTRQAGAASRDPDRFEEQIARIGETARSTIESIQYLVSGLHGEAESLESFVQNACGYIERFTASSTLRLRFDIPENLPPHELPASHRHHLLMLLKEALHNAVKHSGASEIKFQLRSIGRAVAFELSDDGRGFEPDLPPRMGRGLGNMKARAAALSAKLEIGSSPNAGTRIHVEFTIP